MSIKATARLTRRPQPLIPRVVTPPGTPTAPKPLSEKTTSTPPTSPRDRSYVSATVPTVDKTKQTFNTIDPSSPSLSARIFTPRNLCILIIGGGTVAIASSFAALTAKVGALGASQLIAANVITFLQPGVVLTGFAIKTGATLTISAASPFVLLGASLVAVPALTALGGYYLYKKVGPAMLALTQRFIEQLPGGSFVLACGSKVLSVFKSSQGTDEVVITPMTEKELADIREYRPTFGMSEEDFLDYHRERIEQEKKEKAKKIKNILPSKEHSSGLQELAKELAKEIAKETVKDAIEDRPEEKKEVAPLLTCGVYLPAGEKRSVRARKPVVAQETPILAASIRSFAKPVRNGVVISASHKKSTDI